MINLTEEQWKKDVQMISWEPLPTPNLPESVTFYHSSSKLFIRQSRNDDGTVTRQLGQRGDFPELYVGKIEDYPLIKAAMNALFQMERDQRYPGIRLELRIALGEKVLLSDNEPL